MDWQGRERRGGLMLRMRPTFRLITGVYKSFMANKEVTPRKGFGTDLA
jgi:hypothetical protein